MWNGRFMDDSARIRLWRFKKRQRQMCHFSLENSNSHELTISIWSTSPTDQALRSRESASDIWLRGVERISVMPGAIVIAGDLLKKTLPCIDLLFGWDKDTQKNNQKVYYPTTKKTKMTFSDCVKPGCLCVFPGILRQPWVKRGQPWGDLSNNNWRSVIQNKGVACLGRK